MSNDGRNATAGKRRIDRVLAEGYLGDLAARDTEEIRRMRADSSEEEALLSYERRLIHGRLALLRFELDRRAGRSEGTMVENLTSILSEDRTPGRGGFQGKDPDLEAFKKPQRRITKLLADDTLAKLPSLTDDQVGERVAELQEAERETSEIRSRLLPVLDALNAEIGRRYVSGEADPSDVL
jgi:hypothetical protein